MFCNNCGTQLPDGTAVCPNCGAALSAGAQMGNAMNNVAGAAQNVFNQAEQTVGSAFNDINQSLNNQGFTTAYVPAGGALKTDRSLLMYILLTIVTCGIYGYWFLYQMAHDVNIACEGDGEETAGLVAFIVLSFVTCGIYSWIWVYKLGNRLSTNAPRYGLSFQENGTTVLLWLILGSCIFGIGYFIGYHILIKNTNQICEAYNRTHGFA
ncbi:MAG: DUF4234 domain-containing protein [Lachnospiraceae bacterium]|nr:DUF4234 domain-containing protein [Lachnospiraceae bacterium]